MLFCLLGGLLMVLYSETFARRSFFRCVEFLISSPGVFAVNVILVASTLAISVFIKRGIALYTTVFLLWVGFSTANGVILLNRPSPFTFSDFMILPSVLDIITVYLNVISIIIIILGIAGAIFGLVMLWKNSPKRQLDPPIDIPLFIILAFSAVFLIPILIMSGSITNDYSDINQAYLDHGFAYSFSRSTVFHGISQPSGYDEKDVTDLLAEIDEKRKNEEKPETQTEPNIIFVQLESFFDISAVKGITLSENPIPNFTALKQSCSSGFLTIPLVGSGTANTEFEILTGMNIDYFSPGEYPYIMALRDNTCESIPFLLKRRGYTAHTMHNNTGTFYSRDEVYPNLGFDTFTPIEFMYDVEYNSLGWAKDKVLITEIDKCLTTTEGRDFVFTVAVQPHGAYSTEPQNGKITVSGIDDPALSNMYNYYVNEIYETDAFIGELVEKYKNYSEPTVIVFYGDHLPDLKLDASQLSRGGMYQTEYVIWSNFGLAKDENAPDLQSYQFSSYFFGNLGIHDGIMNAIHRYYKDDPNYRKYMELMEYDALYGDKFSYKGFEYVKTEIRFGNTEIVPQNAVIDGKTLTVHGENFNEFSVIYVNGKRIDTVFSSENGTLTAVLTRNAENIETISVAQEAKDGTIFAQYPVPLK